MAASSKSEKHYPEVLCSNSCMHADFVVADYSKSGHIIMVYKVIAE